MPRCSEFIGETCQTSPAFDPGCRRAPRRFFSTYAHKNREGNISVEPMLGVWEDDDIVRSAEAV